MCNTINNNELKVEDEKTFLSTYNIEQYERPSVTTDITVFTVNKNEGFDCRKDPELKLNILLVQRGEHPFINNWSLPGGFLKPSETIEECALRNIREKTGVVPLALMPVGTFSEPERDPRGWVISNAFAFVASEEQLEIVNGARTIDAEWFEIDLVNRSSDEYVLSLIREDIKLSATLKETSYKFGKRTFKIIKNDGLAFDHAKIIASALSILRSESQNIEVVFDFLPEKFTLAALQKVQETLTGTPFIAANFRRKIAGFVEETDEFTEGMRHRPAKLFKRRNSL